MTLRSNVAVYCCREDRGNVLGARCLRRRRGAMGRDGRRGTPGPVSREGQRFNPVGSTNKRMDLQDRQRGYQADQGSTS